MSDSSYDKINSMFQYFEHLAVTRESNISVMLKAIATPTQANAKGPNFAGPSNQISRTFSRVVKSMSDGVLFSDESGKLVLVPYGAIVEVRIPSK